MEPTCNSVDATTASRFSIAIVAALCLAATSPARGQATEGKAPDKPFAIEYYYKVKWGSANEFIRLYRKNHYPLLKVQMQEGRIIQMKTEAPRYHGGEEGRWDYRVTIVWKNSVIAHDDYDESPHVKRLFPDQETFTKEEQRRFEILLAHSDVAVVPVDME